MRWDRKLTVFSICALLIVLAAAGTLFWFTQRSMANVSERIAGAAEEGYDRLLARAGRAEKGPRHRLKKMFAKLEFEKECGVWSQECGV